MSDRTLAADGVHSKQHQMDFYISYYFMFKAQQPHCFKKKERKKQASLCHACFSEINSAKLIGTRLKRKLKCSWVNRLFKHLFLSSSPLCFFNCSLPPPCQALFSLSFSGGHRWVLLPHKVIYKRKTLRTNWLYVRKLWWSSNPEPLKGIKTRSYSQMVEK